jgi:hypothetical protein
MALLKKLSFKKGFMKAKNKDWDDVRELDITLSNVKLREEE